MPQTAFRDFVALEQQDSGRRKPRQTQLQELPALTLPDWGAAETRWQSEYRHELSPDLLRACSRRREIDVPLKRLAAHLRVLAAISGQTEVVTGW
ncbi:MAG: hypothetical protein R3E31_16645 [Chloroflexota bacterium]